MPGLRTGPTYRFVQELASGGMGRVELVVRREGTFARAYARKRPLGDLALDVRVRDMLLEEARVAGLVRNAHVVPVLDVGEDEEGVFLVMDFVDGVPLNEMIERLGDRLPLQCLVEIARQIAEGVHAVHEMTTTDGAPMEIVHRDLTPSNVLVGFDGIVRVTDFGIARARDRAALSQPGVRKGKRSYMAPEQLRAEEVDRRTDLFALGIVLGEMTAGTRLHGDVTPAERARRTLHEPPPDIGELRADVPDELVALAFELMARHREDRPRDARLVATRLAAVRDQLRSEEGSIDLGELVRARFDDVRRKNDRMLAEALRDQDPTALVELPADEKTQVDGLASMDLSLPDAGDEPATQPWRLPAEPTSSLVHEQPTVPRGEHPARAEARRRRVAAFAVVGLVVVLSILWAVGGGTSSHDGTDAGASRGSDMTPEPPAAASSIPELAAPELAVPEVAAPEVAAPGLAAPGLAAPGLAAPGLAAREPMVRGPAGHAPSAPTDPVPSARVDPSVERLGAAARVPGDGAATPADPREAHGRAPADPRADRPAASETTTSGPVRTWSWE